MAEELNWRENYKDFNKDLEAKILEANNDNTLVKWSKLLPELMGSEVFMAGEFAEEMVNANGEKMMSILMLQKNGHTVVPFFTSPERMSVLIGPDNNSFDVMKINTVRFMQSVKDKPVVLNPMSPYSRAFSPFDMKVLVAENIDKKPDIKDDVEPVSTEAGGKSVSE